MRGRQVRGPTGPDAPPALVVIAARRYRCIPCGAVILVVPREVRGRRVYSASAIGFALALWGLVLAKIHAQVCTFMSSIPREVLNTPQNAATRGDRERNPPLPAELASKFKLARQKSKLAGKIRGSFFVIKKEYP